MQISTMKATYLGFELSICKRGSNKEAVRKSKVSWLWYECNRCCRLERC